MCEDLVLLAYGASLDVVCDPFLHVRPVVSFLGLSEGFVSPQVSCGGVVMYKPHDASFDQVKRWYLDFGLSWCSGYSEFLWGQDYDFLVVILTLVCTWESR